MVKVIQLVGGGSGLRYTSVPVPTSPRATPRSCALCMGVQPKRVFFVLIPVYLFGCTSS